MGNRLSQSHDDGSVLHEDTYSYDTASHRLLGVSRLTNSLPSGTRNFTYDATGNRIAGDYSGRRCHLDSSEKFSLGGAQAVRGYPVGEASADEALLASVELRYQWTPAWQVKVFADGGYARLARQPVQSEGNHRNISGIGLGGEWRPASDWVFSAAIAQRTGEQPVSDKDRSPRAWAQAQWLF